MKRPTTRAILRSLTIVAAIGVTGVGASCVRKSGEVWYFKEAPKAEGWPELTPVGEVELRTYPMYREAQATAERLGDAGMGSMFGELFSHISERDIAMTAPVDFGYDDQGEVRQMAFLYRTTQQGTIEQDGSVLVRDVEPMTFASVGVRGGYNHKNFEKGLERVEAWLDETGTHTASGEPRYLGYNSPFILWFWKYGEVQVPVVELD